MNDIHRRGWTAMCLACRTSRRLLAVLFILTIILASAPTASALTPDLATATLDAKIDFGERITFRMEAPWEGVAPTQVTARYRLPDGLVTNRGVADVAVQGATLSAAFAWDLGGTIVPGVQVEYWFEVENRNGAAMLSPSAVVLYMDHDLPWESTLVGRVEIWWHAGGDGMADAARRGVQTAVDLLRREYGVDLYRTTRLILYSDITQMQRALGGGTSPWVGGAAIAELNVTILHAPAFPRDDDGTAAVIAHELTHIVIEHATENPFGQVPAWLHEGLATIVEGTIDERFNYDEILANALDRGELVSLRGITGSFPANNQRAVLAYAQSNSLVRFIIEEWGQESVEQLLNAYAEGVTDDEAAQAALGVSLDELERRWIEHLGIEAPAFAGSAELGAAPRGEGPPGVPQASDTTEHPVAAPSSAIWASLAIVAVVSALIVVATSRRRVDQLDRRLQ